jgi:flagellar biosynthesis protein FliR
MSVEQLIDVVQVFVLVFFRLAGMMLFAPLFGSSRIPRRVKMLLTLMLAFGMCVSVQLPEQLPQTMWELTLGIGGEMIFGLAMGMIVSFVFIAGQWAGEIMGQQMGLNMSEVFDPQFGQSGSIVGELYFMLTLVVFLAMQGHHAMLRGVRASFEALPLLSVGMTDSLLELMTSFFMGCTSLAVQLAGPMIVTILVVDLALGAISKTMPQLNVMTAGLTIRSLVGMVVLIFGLLITPRIIEGALDRAMETVQLHWTTPVR